MKSLLYVLLVLLALLSYMGVALVLEVDQRVPWPQLLVAAAGLGLLVQGLFQKFTWSGLVASSVAALMIGLFSWWVFVYSEYPSSRQLPEAGQALALAELTLPDQDSRPVPLAKLLAEPGPLLMVFYRGHW